MPIHTGLAAVANNERRYVDSDTRLAPQPPPPPPRGRSQSPGEKADIQRLAYNQVPPASANLKSPQLIRQSTAPVYANQQHSDYFAFQVPAASESTYSISSGQTFTNSQPNLLLRSPLPAPGQRTSLDDDSSEFTYINQLDDDSDDNYIPGTDEGEKLTEYPDSSRANRRPPYSRSVPREIPLRYDVKVFSVSGEYIVTSSTITKVWSVKTGLCLGLVLHQDFKVTSVGFKPSRDVDREGLFIWLGTKEGALLEADLKKFRVVNRRIGAHNTPVKGIYRCGYEMWTLDEDGRLQIWGPDHTDGLPSLLGTPRTHRVQAGSHVAVVVGKQFWVGRGRQVNVFQPSALAETQFAVSRPMSAISDNAGDITCATTLPTDPDRVYFGHDTGRVSIYSRSKLSCVDVISLSINKVTSMAGVGRYLWVAFRTGVIYVYDTSQQPWVVLKDWKGHDGPITELVVDRTSIFKMGMLPVLSMTTADNTMNIWDGLMTDDWIDRDLQSHEEEFCTFRSVQALICTWNIGASKPTDLQNDQDSAKFLKRLLATANDPEIIVFGFQELVELDNKTVTAKSIFKKKKHKEANAQQHMSHQYQAWQDRLSLAVSKLPSSYFLLRSENLIGLYSCIFVKDSEYKHVGNLSSSTVKTGLGGLHGNKGAIVLRFSIDHSSLCFVNCHLAAGQSHIIARNNDLAAILESKIPLPRSGLATGSIESADDIFVSGGDGSMVLDHEICFVSGDMNFRINLQRQPVMKMIERREIDKLLEFDQLITQLKRNPGFRLRPFNECPITFNPTYKYDVGTDIYDTSEKKRTPAWCDRIYFRGPGRIEATDYRDHIVRVSDHRPVSGVYAINIKTVDQDLKHKAVKRAIHGWQEYMNESIERARLHFLENEFSS
ncbi:Endonuclease/exonuclease/phosphatase [Lipomyces oligophaga]|uniref:Endonuclease/exonuclease/phosphatase n=1 Tax=Lipomyces oligophaga TaxID=45792 RepID=UPI0034CF9A53